MSIVTVNGQATSFDLPNYVGELFRLYEQPNNFLRLIGGLSGGVRIVGNIEYTLGVDYQVADGVQSGALEGATPTASETGTNQSSNILQIFQYAVDMTYTRQSANEAIGGLAVIPGQSQGPLQHPGTLAWQLDRKTEKAQNDMNFSFLRGTYQKPVDNTTVRKTRGVLSAVATNLFANGGTPRNLTKTIFENALRDMVANGAFPMGGTVYAIAPAAQIDNIVSLYKTDTVLPTSREIVGVQVRVVVTTWGTVVLVYEPAMPAGNILFCQPTKIQPVAMVIKSAQTVKGLFFAEPLAKSGSADKYQMYGEWGVDYTHEIYHGLIKDLN